MEKRKRLLRANKMPIDSFDASASLESKPSNVLEKIGNQNLYLKLVGITLQLSKEAGVSGESLKELQSKLLSAKGFSQYHMLNPKSRQQASENEGSIANRAYNESKKYLDFKQQIVFLSQMEKQVKESEAKEHIVFALKKYIADKKKTISNEFIQNSRPTRKDRFNEKMNLKFGNNKVSKANFYSQTLREILGRISDRPDRAYETISNILHLKTFWGHTFYSEAEEEYCPVYNAIFDNTERLIITGGEDGLIKVWSKDTGALLSTLKGHKDYINKICITKDNKFILSAAQDGVRFFDLDTMSAAGGFMIPSIMEIAEVNPKGKKDFDIIFANGENLFVLDSQAMIAHKNRKLEPHNFQIYNFSSHLRQQQGLNATTLLVNPENIIFLGFTSGQILIFDFNRLNEAQAMKSERGVYESGQDRSLELILPIMSVINAHEESIIQIKWNPILSYLTTGAKKDGACKIWEFKSEQNFKPTFLKDLKIPKYKIKRKKKVYCCNFVCWNSTFSHLTCSFMEEDQDEQSDSRGDGEVLVYNSKTSEITWEMSRSVDLSSIRCMDSHPFYPNIVLICDSYGKILLVDIFENFIINIFEERAYHLAHPTFYLVPSECRFSQDGLYFIVSTEYGNVSLYGYDLKDFYRIYPIEQFYENDYEPFEIDPTSLKPVIDLSSNPLDINQFYKGSLQNIRKQNYRNLPTINAVYFKRNIENLISMEDHINDCNISRETLERISQNYLEYDRNFGVFAQNIEEEENKRLAMMYEERESKQNKLKEIIQQKINRIKEVDLNDISITNSSTISLNGQRERGRESCALEQRQREDRPRRRVGRQRTRNNFSTNSRFQNSLTYNEEENEESSFERVEENKNQEEEYRVEGNISEVDELQSQDDEQDDDQQFVEDDSQYVYRNNRSRRNTNRNNRNRNNRGMLTNYQRARRFQRRPLNEEILELENAYDEQMTGRARKRIQRAEDEGLNEVQAQNVHRIVRRSTFQNLSMRVSQTCNLCEMRDSTVECSICHSRKYCDACKSARGKKSNQNRHFTCYQCFYKSNRAPEVHKNVDHDKYIQTERDEFLFVPQEGDEVAYFFQGYQEFLNDKIQVLNNKFIFEDVEFDLIPHEDRAELMSPVKCKVMEISYAFPLQQGSDEPGYKSNRGARGRSQNRVNSESILAFIRLKSPNGTQFWVYHIPGYEFLLKWEVYQDVVSNDRFAKFNLYDIAFIKDQQIQIMNIRPLSALYPDSIWKKIIVHKADNKNLRHKDKNEDIAVNIWNITGFVSASAFEYQSSLTPELQEHYSSQIQKIQFTHPQIWSFFYDFVDVNLFPSYYEFVEVGVSLKLILARLFHYYKSGESFIHDVNMLASNAVKFNGEDGYVTELSYQLVSIILHGENFNYENIAENQEIQSTDKKTKAKKRLNMGSSNNSSLSGSHQQASQKVKKKFEEPSVLKFNEESSSLVKIKRKRKVREVEPEKEYIGQESADEDSMSNENDSGQVIRSRLRKRKNPISKQQSSNAIRVTRSRMKK